ncbi:fungal hydrophobin [Dendrothele bispora CBS 962.96]|uniref:Hydrophobin n=1 Tax=Dendrothele bispora (strain CBS 962.96) TaxID=1314807 RepID=A0A4S8KIP8_DENBC|nr:fungal hydrophobin [Dendrothele bispora CBS 962.96]
MFSRVSTLFVAAFTATLAVATCPATTTTVTATAPATTQTISPSQCNTGPIQCCNSVQQASSPAATELCGLLGIVVQGADVLVGVTCNPISVIGIGGNSCNAQPVCCENNDFNGVVAIGCVPVNINL